ncbi:MAG: serine hydrolase [Ferroplasma sp.]
MLENKKIESIMNQYHNNMGIGIYKDFEMIYELNPDLKFLSASIIKIFILAYILEKKISVKSVDLSRAKITEDSILKFLISPVDSGFLAALMIAESDNTAANYFIDLIGLNELNNYFKESGFSSTHLGRHFLDYGAIKDGSDNYTSPRDIYNLFIYAEKRGFYENFLDYLYSQKDHSGCSLYLDDAIKLAGKSGLLGNVMSDVLFYRYKRHNFLNIIITNNMPPLIAREFITAYCYNLYLELK